MNSMDCIIGPGTEFLEEYRLLLRADIDTFPLPYLLGFWPKQVAGSCRYSQYLVHYRWWLTDTTAQHMALKLLKEH